MKKYSISVSTIKKIINEELNHVEIKTVVDNASELLSAINDFTESASSTALNALTPQLDSMKKVLNDMLHTPSSYVEKKKKEKVHISFKPTKVV